MVTRPFSLEKYHEVKTGFKINKDKIHISKYKQEMAPLSRKPLIHLRLDSYNLSPTLFLRLFLVAVLVRPPLLTGSEVCVFVWNFLFFTLILCLGNKKEMGKPQSRMDVLTILRVRTHCGVKGTAQLL